MFLKYHLMIRKKDVLNKIELKHYLLSTISNFDSKLKPAQNIIFKKCTVVLNAIKFNIF